MKIKNAMVSKFMGLSILATLMTSFGITSAKADLMLKFTNDPSLDMSNVYLTVRRGVNGATGTEGVDQTSPGATITNFLPILSYADGSGGGNNPFTWTVMYNGLTNTPSGGYGGLYSDSIQLSTILQHGGLDFSSLNTPSTGYSTIFYVSYGSGIVNSTNYVNGDIGFSSSSDPNYNTKFQPFEISYANQPGDQGDSTAINYFSSQISLSSYTNSSATGTPVQQRGYIQSTATLYNTFTSNISTSVGGYVTNSVNSADIVRVLGPNSYLPNLGPYTNLNSYLGAVETNSSLPQLQIGNSSGFSDGVTNASHPNAGPNSAYTNATCVFLMTNTVSGDANSGYGLNATGNIVVTYSTYNTNSLSPTNPAFSNSYSVTYTNISYNVTAINTNSAATFIYGGNVVSNSSFSGIGTNSFSQFVSAMANFTNGAGTLGSLTLQEQIAGELAAAFTTGLAGSTNTNSSGQQLGSLVSSNWWVSTTANAFGYAQTNPNFYAQYAGYIYNASSNGIYGSPYTDRFINQTPDINVVNYGGTNIGSLLVDIGLPIGSVPEPSSILLLGIGTLAGAFILRRRSSI